MCRNDILDIKGSQAQTAVTKCKLRPMFSFKRRRDSISPKAHIVSVFQNGCHDPKQECPKHSHHVWQIPVNHMHQNDGKDDSDCYTADIHCTYCWDDCSTQKRAQEVMYNFLMHNFRRHYKSPNKAPLGIYNHGLLYHDRYGDGARNAMKQFIHEVLTNHDDVWIVTFYQLIQWIANPVELSKLKHSDIFAC